MCRGFIQVYSWEPRGIQDCSWRRLGEAGGGGRDSFLPGTRGCAHAWLFYEYYQVRPARGRAAPLWGSGPFFGGTVKAWPGVLWESGAISREIRDIPTFRGCSLLSGVLGAQVSQHWGSSVRFISVGGVACSNGAVVPELVSLLRSPLLRPLITPSRVATTTCKTKIHFPVAGGD